VRNSVQTTGRSVATGSKAVGSDQYTTEFQFKLDTEFVRGVTGLFYFNEEQSGRNNAGVWNTTQLGNDRNLDVLAANNIDPLYALELCHLTEFAYNPRRADGRPNPVPNLCGYSVHNTEAYAVFSQYLINLGLLSPALSTLTLKVGGRYSHERREVSNPGVSINAVTPTVRLFLPENAHAEKSFADFTPEIGVEWRPSDNVLAYYTYSEGFKSGVGENNAGSTTIVDPETIQNHEIGLKASLLDNRLIINAAAYKYDFQGLQVQRSVQACNGCTPVQVFENATAVSGKGAELEVRARVGHSLRLNGAVSYLDSKYEDYVTFDGLDYRNVTGPTTLGNIAPAKQLAGNPTRNSPKWTLSGGAEFDIPVNFTQGGILTPRVDVFHRSTVYYSDFARLIEGQAPYTMIDASLQYHSPNSSLRLTAWIKNLTNELVVSGTWPLRTGGIIGNFYYPPRTFGVTANYQL
jgi:iron complex outermembrane receptor protein